MSDQDCNCANPPVDQTPKQTSNTDSWITERPVKTAKLPAAVADNMSRIFDESINDFDDIVAVIRTVVEGDGIVVDELCHVEGETPHHAITDGQTYYFRCFYDGIALAHLVDEPVELHTETPTSEPIEIQASPAGDTEVTPSDAVMSFGIASHSDVPADGEPTAQELYESICPYVKAFQSREDYTQWAAGVPATTVGFPLESGAPIAAAVTAESPSTPEE